MNIKTICCKEEMIFDNNYFNGQDYISYTCLKCGCFKTLVCGTLDEEELNDLREGNN